MKTRKPTFLVSRCYSERTPESAEDGDFSDSGSVYKDTEFTAQELAREIEDGGFRRDGCTDWLQTPWDTTDYSTGTERGESLHFSRNNPPRLKKHFDRIALIASR